MKQTITLILLLTCLNTIAQIKFEKGYIINNNGKKIECLIKNEDWLHNPSNFIYKIDNTSKEVIGNLYSIKEFGVNGYSKYNRFKVGIDKSNTNVNKLSKNRTYDFVEETLFLKVLVEGKANLYVYNEGNIVKYFYKKEDKPIYQLEYKEYLNSKNYLVKNKNYLTQLRLDVSCDKINYKNVDYNKNSLVKYFLAYNNCNDSNAPIKDYTKSKSNSKTNFGVKLGIGNSSILYENSLYGYRNIKSSGINLRIGFEAEYVLPFNKNKWAFFVEPTYQTYKSDIERGNTQIGEITYNSIEIPIGVKHYMFINQNSKLFLDGAYVIDFPISSSSDFNNSANLEIDSSPSVNLGFGYSHKNKYSVEVRYYLTRDLSDNYQFWRTKYSSASIILGYSF
ncbi:hypothetical protein H9W90_05905 [Polaribacter pectinis]|uniref:Outer membrane protein beta-barrel domain-containing protein n=1 Tax=Polaribacter pectinis TaxID=2738844 RepID=A0A7G9LDF2_9FLAO|nr:hypothetical protein [Polaribacter pectinis]QNM86651.1 hypothetical protein H9W90_05905 [Polaribacter pectinis]